MIELISGVPGSGKTLLAVGELAAMLASWEKSSDLARPVFVHGIKDLAIPHAAVPVIPGPGGKGQAVDWDAMPDGSFVVVDEAQDLFPPRSTQSAPPPHIAWLNTHRHRGFDIVVLTQHPKLVDGSMRALVGKHRHLRRVFGGQRSITYEWDACSDSLQTKSAVTGYFSFPKSTFQHYKSAEIHTKPKFKYPAWLIVPGIAVVLAVVTIPRAASSLASGISGEGIGNAKPPGAMSALADIAPGGAASGARGVEPARAGDRAQVVVAAAPARRVVAGCMTMRGRCVCVEVDGAVAVDVSESECLAASVELGGLVPYDTTARAPVQAGQAGQAGAAIPLPR